VQERAGHIADWVRITNAAEKVKAHIAPLEKLHDRGRPNQGINAAVRELSLDRTDVQRAIKIAGLTSEAKKVAVEVGLDDNASALLGECVTGHFGGLFFLASSHSAKITSTCAVSVRFSCFAAFSRAAFIAGSTRAPKGIFAIVKFLPIDS
jgi:hypothetical protein